MSGGIDFPDFLDAQPVFLRRLALVQAELADQALGEPAARAFVVVSLFAAEFAASGDGRCRRAVAPLAQAAGAEAETFAILPGEEIGGGSAGETIDPQCFGALAEPAAEIAQRDDQRALCFH